MTDPAARARTAVDAIAEDHFEQSLALDPAALTQLGRPERQDEYPDLSPAGLEQFHALNLATLARLDEVTPSDPIDEVTVAAMRERLGLEVERHELGHDLLSINNITSGLHAIRSVYDAMPTATSDHWRTIVARLHAVAPAIEGWFQSQQASVERGIAPSRRQVLQLAERSAGR